ncbi:MAG TPA: hypothetical protein VIX73_07340 [Kofleriaceae bacterium]
MTRGTGIAIPCATCAAALPVDLLPDGDAQRAVTQLQAQAQVEGLRTEATRAPALENLIAMTTFAQLITAIIKICATIASAPALLQPNP